MRIRFAKSTRKHRIGHAHARYVMANYQASETVTKRGDDGWEWIGADETGRVLHIIAVEQENGEVLFVIHLMPQYR